MPDILSQCHKKSLKCLQDNIQNTGFSSSYSDLPVSDVNRTLICADNCLAALSLLTVENAKLIEHAKKTLLAFGKHQNTFGQIPDALKKNKPEFFFPTRVESTLWWLISAVIFSSFTEEKKFQSEVEEKIHGAFRFLFQKTHSSLLEQGICSVWNNNLSCQGWNLYSNALWYKAVTQYAEYADHDSSLKKFSKDIKNAINSIFWIHKRKTSDHNFIPEKDPLFKNNSSCLADMEAMNADLVGLPYYASYFAGKKYGRRCDVLANILVMLFDIAEKRKTALIEDFFHHANITDPFPIITLYPTIYPGEKEWNDIMDGENYPWQKFNGGAWPSAGAWYAMQKNKKGDYARAKNLLESIASANQAGGFAWHEYAHGTSGKPMGNIGSTQNAAMFLIAYDIILGDGALKPFLS